mmetsp:Transcript_54465/g.82522  ORF Transcript_54465/g.82522 Transcript_54465/m.82522 type:complete len:94 (+) Transcript_54465:64-345(+)
MSRISSMVSGQRLLFNAAQQSLRKPGRVNTLSTANMPNRFEITSRKNYDHKRRPLELEAEAQEEEIIKAEERVAQAGPPKHSSSGDINDRIER